MSDKNALAMAKLYNVMQKLIAELDKDVPISYALAFLRVAMAGSEGVDARRVMADTNASNTGMDRMVRRLGAKEGFGIVERLMNDDDLRFRTIRLTAKGEKAAARIADHVAKL